MDFDEYEYLEKTVEETEAGSKKKDDNVEKRYRKRREDDDDHHNRDEEDGDDDRKKKKRSRNEEENGVDRKREDRDRDRRREKEDRHRDRRDRDKEKDSEKEKERERSKRHDSRDPEMSRDRDREKSKRHGSREPEKERERSRRRGSREPEMSRERDRSKRHGSREPERERSRRSSSRSKRHDSQDREREREMSRERKERERERELREIEARDSRRYKEKKEAAEPEVDPERDQRTVFAYQMPLKATEKDVYDFFSTAGKVRDVRLIMDRNSRRSKGVGYIEFVDAMSVPMAIAKSGQLLLGQPVMVKPSEAEKNLVQSTAASGSTVTGPYGPTDRKLYVGNLHFNMTEQQLRQIFEPFGAVELVQLPLDLETGHCKGFGFVQFSQVDHAKAAQSLLNGKIEIAGRYIKVSSVTEHVSGQDTGTTAADFDDDDGGGLALNARSRALLMQKLDRTGTASGFAGTLGVLNSTTSVQQPSVFNGHSATPAPTLHDQLLPSPASEPVGTPSECLLLKNLFDPATETDPEFDLDIKEDVGEECSKFGQVRHIYVDKHSAGHVYLRFDSKDAAMNAQRGMHMRWFARRLISAIFMQPQDYEAKFVDAF